MGYRILSFGGDLFVGLRLRVDRGDAILAPVEFDGLTGARALLGGGGDLADGERLPACHHHGFTIWKYY